MSSQKLYRESFEKIVRKSDKGNFRAPYNDLGSFQYLIKKEDGFIIDLFDLYQVKVKENENGSYVIFDNPIQEKKTNPNQSKFYPRRRVQKVQAKPLESVNQLLSTSNNYIVINPVSSNDEVLAILDETSDKGVQT